MRDFMSTNEEEIRDQTLNMNEEAHYFHTINDFVELIVLYGQDKVMHDLKLAIGWKKT